MRAKRIPRRRDAEFPGELHAQLIEQIPGAVFRLSSDAPNERFTFMSPQAEALVGYSPERWLQDPGFWLTIVHPDDLERVRGAWMDAVAAVTRFDCEYRVRHADGSWIWVREDTRPVVTEDGSIEAWQGLTLDITEQRQAEKERRDTEARYRALVEQLPAVVYVDSDDASPRSLYVSPASERILGYAAEDYRADPTLWPRTIHPDDRERVLTEWAEAVRSGDPFHTTYRFVRSDGGSVWVRDTSILIRDNDGAPLYWQGVILDVSAQARAEQDAREQQARYEALVEGIPAVVYEMDLDDERRTLYVNRQIEELLGYTRSEWLDQPDIWIELLHPDDREVELEAHDRHTETGEPWRREYRLIASDGRVVWVRDQAVLVTDPKGEPLTWQGVMLDITVQKEAEEQLRTANDDLEFRVLARTSQLAEANELMSLEIGERRRAERELREAQDRYRHLVEDLPAVIYTWQTRPGKDDSDDQSYVSPQIEQLVGFTPSEWHADWGIWTSRLHPHDRDAVMAATRHTLTTGEPFQMEYRYLAKDGRIVWVLDLASLLQRDDEGRPFILQGVMMDITDRKAAEHKAAEAEARIRDMTEESPVSTWAMQLSYETDPPHTTVEYVGPRIAESLGFPVSRWIDDPAEWSAMIHPDDRERLLEMTTQNLSHGTPWTVDFRMIAADGRVIWVQDRGRCVDRDHLGRPTRFVGAVLDVTRQQEAITALHAEADAMRTLLEGLPAVPWTEIADPNGWHRYAYIGPQAREAFGYEPEELINEPNFVERILHPDDLPRFAARARLSNVTGEPWVDRFRGRHRDGTYRWYHAAARRVSGDGETPAIWQGITIDITPYRDGDPSGERLIRLGDAGSDAAPSPAQEGPPS